MNRGRRDSSGRSYPPGWLSWGSAGLLAALVWGIFAVWEPSSSLDSSICLLRRHTGLACPGCGMIRALAALAKGEVGAALTLHPLSLPFVGLAVLAWFAWGIRAARGEGRPLPLRWWLWGGGAGYGLLAAVWIVRFARGTLPP